MIVRKNYAFYLLTECIIFVILLFGLSMSGMTEVDKEKFIGAITIINIFFFFLTMKKNDYEMLSISTLFIAFMYLFNLGVPIARFLNWIDDVDEAYLRRLIYSMGTDTFISYMMYAFLLITMLQIGVLYYYNVSYVQNKANSILENYDELLPRCKYIGIICVLIGAMPYFYSEYGFMKNAMVYGYQNEQSTFNLSGTGIGLLGNLFLVGIMMLFVYFQKDKRKFDLMFIVMCLYQVFRMYISGDRSTGVALILVWVLIRHKYVKPIKGKNAIIYILLIYVAFVFLKFVEMTRGMDTKSVDGVLTELIQSNIVAKTTFEYGVNVWSGMMVFYSVPSTASFRYGLTYLAGIIGKPLSLLGLTNAVWQYSDFSILLKEPERGALINRLTASMGGSFSGEWYLNFGWGGLILIVFFGYILAKFSDICVSKKSNPVVAGFFMYVATLVIWWVRQYFNSVSWYTIFYGIIVFILYQFIANKEKRVINSSSKINSSD